MYQKSVYNLCDIVICEIYVTTICQVSMYAYK